MRAFNTSFSNLKNMQIFLSKNIENVNKIIKKIGL